MSDSEEENFCYIGRPLAPYDEDAFPKKKPIAIEDQVATDEHGRRRFHGAFTGGFSAGFFNTVGSLEGWTPSEFRSTRQDKAAKTSQKPEDFMDAEDIGQFGIAPQTVQATSNYAVNKKRKRVPFNEGPIPGEPVLHSLLSSGNETIGYILLKNMGLKSKSKNEVREDESDRVYGCEMPKTYEIARHDDDDQYQIPEIYKEFLAKPKSNTFGLGYAGLDNTHLNLFKSDNLVIREKGKKKFEVSGQAFGVGAFEDDDEDIYVKEDMSRYDFELTAENANKKNKTPQANIIFEDYVKGKQVIVLKDYPPPTIPHSFTGKYKIKKSRFEPVIEEAPRRSMDAEMRAHYLGEEITRSDPVPPADVKVVVKQENEEIPANNIATVDLISDRFVSASYLDDSDNLAPVVKSLESEHGTAEMRAAVKMKMFGPLTRIVTDWQPCSMLCKRFNVPEIAGNQVKAGENRKRTKNLIFQYEQFSQTIPELNPGLNTCQTIIKTTDTATDDDPSKTETTETQASAEIPAPEPSASSTDNKEPDKVSDPTEKIDVAKNIDLFKSIFLSSDESEDETEEPNNTEKEAEFKANVLSDNFLSKIKPIKEGILSNMDFAAISMPHSSPSPSQTAAVTDDLNVVDDDLYGPKLPQSIRKAPEKCVKQNVDEDSDDWIEKTDKGEKEVKKHHKKKQKKHKHKKKHRRR